MGRMLIVLGSVLFLLSAWMGPTWADEAVELKDGRKVLLKSDGTYEFIEKPPSDNLKGKYRKIEIIDLKLDLKEMIDQRVSVKGYINIFGEFTLLTDPEIMFDTNGIPLDVSNLAREDRKYLMGTCTSEQCLVEVFGIIKTNIMLFQPGIYVEKLAY